MTSVRLRDSVRFPLPGLQRSAILAAGMVLAVAAHGACSRPINVPLSATGKSVVVDRGNLTGVYPDFFNSLSTRSGCVFTLSAMPRSRQELLFRAGQVDVLAPASRSPERDKSGYFVPLIHIRAELISNQKIVGDVHSVAQLLSSSKLRVGVVRGFDYGNTYQRMLAELERQGRLVVDVDAVAIGMLMKAGLVDATVMSPSIFAGSVESDARVSDLFPHLHYLALDDMPWSESGLYLSKASLSASDAQALKDIFEHSLTSASVWAAYAKAYSPEIMRESFRPR